MMGRIRYFDRYPDSRRSIRLGNDTGAGSRVLALYQERVTYMTTKWAGFICSFSSPKGVWYDMGSEKYGGKKVSEHQKVTGMKPEDGLADGDSIVRTGDDRLLNSHKSA